MNKFVKCIQEEFGGLLVSGRMYRVIEEVEIDGHTYYAVREAETGIRVGIFHSGNFE